jgi:ATP-binding protein involved in chromosome partitioning
MSEHVCSSAGQGSCPGKDCPSHDQLATNMAGIKHKIVVLSGKGGVGKSTVATNLAVALSLSGAKVGLLDVDVHGPSVPHLLKLSGSYPQIENDALMPVPWSENLGVMSVGFLLEKADEAVIWRGPRKTGVIDQFLREVKWGKLDYLVVDCPPGTGDEPLAVLQKMQPDVHAVVVTTPQEVAVNDVRRSISFCRTVDSSVLGIVENMSGYVCPHCGQIDDIFSSDGGVNLAAEMGVPFLGRIPLDPKLVRAGDQGNVFVQGEQDGPTAEAFRRIVRPVLDLNQQG